MHVFCVFLCLVQQCTVFCFTSCYSHINSHISKCEVCVMLKLFPAISITLKQIWVFQTSSRAELITYVELTEVTEWKNAFQALLLLCSSYPLGCLGKDTFSQWRCSSHGCLAGLDTHWCHILDSLLSLFSSVSSIRDTPETQERRSIYSCWRAYSWGIIWWEPKGSLKNNCPAAPHGSLNHHYWGRGHCVVLWKETWDAGTEPMSSSQSTLRHYLSGLTADKDFNHLCSFLCF